MPSPLPLDAREDDPGERTGARNVRVPLPVAPLAPTHGGCSTAAPTTAPVDLVEPPGSEPLPLGEAARAFRDRFFPEASDADWGHWKWQLQNRIRDRAGLDRILALAGDERAALEGLGTRLPVGITPYYAALLVGGDGAAALRRTMVPLAGELVTGPDEAEDPLAEDAFMPVPGLVHRYPDRVLFLVTSFCATYCRYCTRSRLVGKTGEYHFNRAQFELALGYLREHTEVRDVLISGGDPLTMDDGRLDWLLARLRELPHIELVRLGTKVPAVLPQRITGGLTRMLRRHHPLWLSLHFMHPAELTPETVAACARLADAGIPLGAQIVLVRGVNDDLGTMKQLVHGLLRARVRPYYLYQCDPIPGSAHFRTPVQTGLRLLEGLRGHTTGYAVPTFVVDAPGGGGKIPLMPDYVLGRDGESLLLRNFRGQPYRVADPASEG